MSETSLQSGVLIDTGPLVAIFGQADEHHAQCVRTLQRIVPPMLTTWPVLTEAAYLLRTWPAALQRLFAAPKSGLFRVASIEEQELPQLAALMKKHQSLRIQVAGASLVYVAQRENLNAVFTLDRRDFSALRGPRNRPFRLLP